MARRIGKSASAFRTISEVADDLDVPQHVLRFWETRFPQVRPLKRGGGRRYYRPEDVDLLRAIRSLLYQEGYTIKGVQKLMREGALKARAQPPAEPERVLPSTPGAEPMPSERDIKRRTQLDLAIDDLAELRN
ncbi:MAG: MerR family transcriptional regulator, partial [Dongiaceae bacterium]